MKYIFDTKYIESKGNIDLVSVGIVCEDGREFYAINEDCNFSKATDWMLENVLAPIGITLDGKQVVYFADASCDINLYGMSKNDIKKLVLDFVGNKQPECWTQWAEYNWDILCQVLDLNVPLFGDNRENL